MEQSLLQLASTLFIFAIFGISSPASAQGGFGLSNLDDQTRKQVKTAYCFHKLQSGAAYSECVKKKLENAINLSVGQPRRAAIHHGVFQQFGGKRTPKINR